MFLGSLSLCPDFAVRVVAAAEAGGRHRIDLVGFSLGAVLWTNCEKSLNLNGPI
jgi:hypothetical protein